MPQEVKARLWYKTKKNKKQQHPFTLLYKCGHHRECKCKFRLKTDLTSLVNRRASNIGKRSRSAVSCGSENQDIMGIALSEERVRSAGHESSWLKDVPSYLNCGLNQGERLRHLVHAVHCQTYTWVPSVCSGGVIKNEDTGEILTDCH